MKLASLERHQCVISYQTSLERREKVRREIGRWAGSLAKDLIPIDPITDHMMDPMRQGMADLPDRYAQEAAPSVICAIIKRQVSKCVTVVEATDFEYLELFGEWERFIPRQIT